MLLNFLLSLISLVTAQSSSSRSCQDVDTIDWNLRDAYCDQPLFFTFLPRSEDNELLDNVCFTFFPLPDDPDTFQVYKAQVFCDGSTDISSSISTQISLGVNRIANSFHTVTDHVIGYAGCDTYLVYQCGDYGDSPEPYVFGLSTTCRAIGLSCLRKVEEIITDKGIPEQDYYVLPMKLPNRCVTQQLCQQHPNPFYNKLPSLFSI